MIDVSGTSRASVQGVLHQLRPESRSYIKESWYVVAPGYAYTVKYRLTEDQLLRTMPTALAGHFYNWLVFGTHYKGFQLVFHIETEHNTIWACEYDGEYFSLFYGMQHSVDQKRWWLTDQTDTPEAEFPEIVALKNFREKLLTIGKAAK